MTPIPVFAAAVGPAEILLAVFVLASAVLAGLLAAA